MILDSDGPDRAAFDAEAGNEFDLCVIGSGPAGIALARKVAARGFSVALMEGGGREWTPESQDLYRGEIVGVPTHDLDTARLRYFGGTSGHWNGRTRPLDAADFRGNPADPLSGWPIGRADLDPYAAETAAILDLPDTPLLDANADQTIPGLHQVSFRYSGTEESGPVRFGEKFADELAASEAIRVGLHANLVDLRLEEDFAGADAPAVVAAMFRGYGAGDAGFIVRARHYALCCGGIENPRLLLNFTSQLPAGIGNQNDLVGRYFMDHPVVRLGDVLLARPEEWAGPPLHFAPSEAFMAAEGTRNFACALRWAPQEPLNFMREALRSAQCDVPFAERLAEAVLGDRAMNCNIGGLAQWWVRRDPYRDALARAVVDMEEAPYPASRVSLAETRDALGLLQPRLDWQFSEIDHHTLAVAARTLGGHVAETDIGRLQLFDWVAGEEVRFPSDEENERPLSSWHHMGTTRMADDPRQGVVDAHARVHGIANLHIGGSSIFATGGYVNPTYTIVQLALRLGDRLAEELAS